MDIAPLDAGSSPAWRREGLPPHRPAWTGPAWRGKRTACASSVGEDGCLRINGRGQVKEEKDCLRIDRRLMPPLW